MTDSTLDTILALQLSVAWAGEGLCEPKRLDWWRTDLIDRAGCGYLFQQLLPKTYEWASLEAARKAAMTQDKQIRQSMSQPDQVRTLFFWGFAVDEQLSDRLLEHKRNGDSLAQVLPLPLDLESAFTKAAFEGAIRIPSRTVEFQVVPGGREIKEQIPESLELRAYPKT